MRTIKIIEDTLIKGKPHVPGDIVLCSPVDAANLIAAGKGVQVADGTVENRDPVIENRDPKPETDAEKKARLKAEKAAADKAAKEAAEAKKDDTPPAE